MDHRIQTALYRWQKTQDPADAQRLAALMSRMTGDAEVNIPVRIEQPVREEDSTSDGFGNYYQTRVIAVPNGLNFLIGLDLDSWLDYISEAAFGSVLLMDIQYELLDAVDGTLIISVTGDVSAILDEQNDDL